MKKFKNLNTGLVEIVTNESVVKQYEKNTDRYVEIKAKADKKADKPAKEEKPADKPVDENKPADENTAE